MSLSVFYFLYCTVVIFLLSSGPFLHEFGPHGSAWYFLKNHFGYCDCHGPCECSSMDAWYYLGCLAFPITLAIFALIFVCGMPRRLARFLKRRRQKLPTAKVVNDSMLKEEP